MVKIGNVCLILQMYILIKVCMVFYIQYEGSCSSWLYNLKLLNWNKLKRKYIEKVSFFKYFNYLYIYFFLDGIKKIGRLDEQLCIRLSCIEY